MGSRKKREGKREKRKVKEYREEKPETDRQTKRNYHLCVQNAT